MAPGGRTLASLLCALLAASAFVSPPLPRAQQHQSLKHATCFEQKQKQRHQQWRWTSPSFGLELGSSRPPSLRMVGIRLVILLRVKDTPSSNLGVLLGAVGVRGPGTDLTPTLLIDVSVRSEGRGVADRHVAVETAHRSMYHEWNVRSGACAQHAASSAAVMCLCV